MPSPSESQNLRLIPGIPCPVERITGVWRFTREPGWYTRCRSTPGHLLHLLTAGSYSLQANDRRYEVRAGDVIYYHEYEEVACFGNDTPVEFLSVGFLASGLAPLSAERRVFRSTPLIREQFRRLYEAAAGVDDTVRGLATFAALAALLAAVFTGAPAARRPAARDHEVWWEVEQRLRRDRQYHVSLDDLAAGVAASRSTLVRSCRRATGESPRQRQRTLRLEAARGLLGCSTLTISEIARHLGYQRIHEFSREFRRQAGIPPRRWRTQSGIAV
ncbi:MAG: AraC family transcriptional regulator [Lentisphaeria bacterium]